MNERFAVYLLAGAFLATLLWRSIPRAPVSVSTDNTTQGQPTTVPTIPAELIIGQSLTPDDGEAGPVWYTVNYPGRCNAMPPIPSAVAA